MTKEEIYNYIKSCYGFEVSSKGSCSGPKVSYDWEVAILEGKGLIYLSDDLFYFFDSDSFIKINEKDEVFGYKIEEATPESKERVQIFVASGNGEQAFVYELLPRETVHFLSHVTANGKHNISHLRVNEIEGYGIDKYVLRSGALNGATVSVVERLDVIDFIRDTIALGIGQSRTLSNPIQED